MPARFSADQGHQPRHDIASSILGVWPLVAVSSVGVAVLAFGLPLGNVVGAMLVSVINVLLLDRIGDALVLELVVG